MESKDLGIWKFVKWLIKSDHAEISRIADILSHISDKEVIEGTRITRDDPHKHYNWDLLHFAIYAKRRDVVEYFFKEDLFLQDSNAGNKFLPYLHMACVCGDKEIFDLIMRYRPEEQNLIIFTQAADWGCFLNTMRKGK